MEYPVSKKNAHCYSIMNMRIFFRRMMSAFILFFCFAAFARQTKVPSLYSYSLDNGFELFVMENDSAPLVYIEIAVRAGAVTQSPQNAGLFHLYEHMMFKGNAKYANQKEAYEALNKMGVSEWNGTTSIDRVNYFFTIPSSLVKEGLEYWSYAVRTPLIDAKELENEKSVVLSEIEGGMSEPRRIFAAGIFKNLFPSCPWKLDTSGSPEIIKNASREDLLKIQREYYVPENTGLFVGGAVKHEEVFALVKEIYGSWQNSGESKAKEKIETPSKEPFTQMKKLVYPDPRCSAEVSQVVYYLRGPDAQSDEADTYAADVWSYLLANPLGSFVSKAVKNEELNIPDADYTGGSYSTMRSSGLINFSCVFMNDDRLSVPERTDKLLAYWTGEAVDDMLKTGTGYDEGDIKKVKQRLEDSRTYLLETASGFLRSFSSVWATSGADYALDYDEKILEVNADDVQNFVRKYIKDKNGLAVVFVNPAYYAAHKQDFLKDGWQELNAENARWWNIKGE